MYLRNTDELLSNPYDIGILIILSKPPIWDTNNILCHTDELLSNPYDIGILTILSKPPIWDTNNISMSDG